MRGPLEASVSANLQLEEPDAGNLHVRICGSPRRETAAGHPASGHPPGDARRNHYRIALGSAAEVHAVMDILGLSAEDPRRLEIDRVGAMLTKLVRR